MFSRSNRLPPCFDACAPLEAIFERLLSLCQAMAALEEEEGPLLETVASAYRPSARNLLHYVALRQHDIRMLQDQLACLGLSSLGRCESSVMDSVVRVLAILSILAEHPLPNGLSASPIDHRIGQAKVSENSLRLLQAGDSGSGATIMVTLPPEAADDSALVRELLEAGMTIARINCAHDDPLIWERQVAQVKAAVQATGRTCRIAMDLAGPKLRTGPVQPGPSVVACKPRRDQLGKLVTPARILFSPQLASPAAVVGADLVVPVTGESWRKLAPGDVLQGVDASGRHRKLTVETRSREGVLVSATSNCHFTPGLTLVTARGLSLTVGRLPPLEGHLLLRPGDRLLITAGAEPGRDAERSGSGDPIRPATIGCTLPAIFRDVRCGERICFDDGKIEGVILTATSEGLEVEITAARRQGSRLRADKGINLPDSRLHTPALTAKDIRDLAFIVAHADMLNFSFVRSPTDLVLLHEHLVRLGREELGVILKIETRQAFDQLPSLLLAAMRFAGPLGVMIARGDLAIECGWERLAEIQEEMLRVCEAAHLPCIWATQVLEELARRGRPTRAEISDAAMGSRAEGVLLNKGPNIAATVRTLHDIVHRMQDHQQKTRSTFRRLELAAHHHPGLTTA